MSERKNRELGPELEPVGRGRPRKPDVPYRRPTPDERAAGAVMVCAGCDREWPMSMCAPSIDRCVNCARNWWREDKRARRGHYWRLYGMSQDAVREKLDAQGNSCAICDDEIDVGGNGKQAQLDHCHDTGHPRDFLCSRCNRGIGVFGDDPDLVEAASQYLHRHRRMLRVQDDFSRPRRRRAFDRGLPKNPRKPHHILTESGRRVNLSDPNILQLCKEDIEVAEAVDAYIRKKMSGG